MLYFGQDWFEFKSTARGYLLAPGQTLNSTDFYLVKAGQKHHLSNTSLVDGRWLLLFNGTATCDLHCQANLFKMRQARLVLGRDAARVRTVYLLPETTLNPELNEVLTQYPALSVYRINNLIQSSSKIPPLKQNQVYIADPAGNLVLSYAVNAYSRDIIKDFKRLLKASKIG